jgi:RNA polymerase sigma factor (sigma-70 family)
MARRNVSLDEARDQPDPRGDLLDVYLDEIDRAQAMEELEGHLRALPRRERRTIELRYGLRTGHGLGYEQIARRLKLSLGHVWALERRALQHLRQSYGLEAAPELAEAA